MYVQDLTGHLQLCDTSSFSADILLVQPKEQFHTRNLFRLTEHCNWRRRRRRHRNRTNWANRGSITATPPPPPVSLVSRPTTSLPPALSLPSSAPFPSSFRQRTTTAIPLAWHVTPSLPQSVGRCVGQLSGGRTDGTAKWMPSMQTAIDDRETRSRFLNSLCSRARA